MPYTLADAYDDLIDVQLCDLTYEEAVKVKQLIAETICKKFSDDLDTAIQRGDTYQRRALALQLRAKSQRGTIKILQSMLKDTILERNALKKQVDRRDHWIDEALNSGNGTYRP